MRWKGQRQSDNIEDMRGKSSRRSFGLKGGTIVVLGIALVVYLLGGNPSQVLNLLSGGGEETATEAPLSAHDKEMTEFVGVVLAETESVWNKLFQESGRTYREPKLVLFRSGINSACGFAESATGPFYCPADEKVYLDLDYLEKLQQQLGAEGDFAAAYIIAHEIGHHVQNLLGIIDKANRLRASAGEMEANAATVKLELQADFLAGVWVHHGQKMRDFLETGDLEEALNAASAVGDDRIQTQTQGYVTPDSFTHGTSAQRRYWLKKGIDTGDLEQGDTFSAEVD
ncbi:MAG: neutral zinc metallopeptidase [Bacteroidales bacterium]